MTTIKRIRNLDLYTLYGDVLVNAQALAAKQVPQPSGCIHWSGPLHRQGYAFIGGIRMPEQKRIMMTVHRLMLKIKLGRALKPGEESIHVCGNMQCVNPDHLTLGNARERNDMMMKNHPGIRQRPRTGGVRKQNRKYRYSDDEIQWIRAADATEIAERYEVTIFRARSLKHNMTKYYRWLPLESE